MSRQIDLCTHTQPPEHRIESTLYLREFMIAIFIENLFKNLQGNDLSRLKAPNEITKWPWGWQFIRWPKMTSAVIAVSLKTLSATLMAKLNFIVSIYAVCVQTQQLLLILSQFSVCTHKEIYCIKLNAFVCCS